MSEAKDKVLAAMAKLGLTVEATFVPFSKSRNAKPNPKLSDLQLNWRVTVRRNGRDVLTTDYGAGVAHCPAYKKGWREYEKGLAIREECESGREVRGVNSGGFIELRHNKPILPDPADVIACLVSDYGVLDHPTYEEWANELGMDPDSRKGEALYRDCLQTALALRAGVGEMGMAALREAAQDY